MREKEQGTVDSSEKTWEGSRLWRGIWRIIDPKISLASLSSIFLGSCAAANRGAIDWAWLAVTVFGILFLEAAKNASGDVFDFNTGVDQAVSDEDRSPFSGGKRVIIDGLLTSRQTSVLAAVLYVLGIVTGLVVVLFREPAIFWIGLIGVSLAYFYHAPPLKLSYRGLGEIAVAVAYGPLICCGAYIVQRHTLNFVPIVVSLPLGLLIAAFLWINQFPDWAADAGAGKNTLVVRLGRRAASKVFAAIIGSAFLGLLLLPLANLPVAILLGIVGLPHGLAAAKRLWNGEEKTSRIIPAQRWTLLSFVLTALGTGIGFLLST